MVLVVGAKCLLDDGQPANNASRARVPRTRAQTTYEQGAGSVSDLYNHAHYQHSVCVQHSRRTSITARGRGMGEGAHATGICAMSLGGALYSEGSIVRCNGTLPSGKNIAARP